MYAGQNIKALLGEMKYSVARFVAALGGEIPQPRIESWIKGKGAPKNKDTKIICEYFKISSEKLHDHLLTAEEIDMIIKSKNLSVQAKEIKNSTINQIAIDNKEVIYLQEKISLLERLLQERQSRIDEKDRIISILTNGTKSLKQS